MFFDKTYKIIKINSIFPKNPKRKIPKLITSFFLYSLFVHGFDFGFLKIFNKKKYTVLKILSNFCIIAVYVILIWPLTYYKIFPKFEYIFYVSVMFQHAAHIIFLRFTKYNLYDFIKDIYKVDQNVLKGRENMLFSFAIGYFMIIYVVKLTSCELYCIKSTEDGVTCVDFGTPSLLNCAVTFGQDFIFIVQILIYYYIYDAIKRLIGNVQNKSFDLNMIRQQYTNIAECCEKISYLYGKLMIVELMVNLPKLLTTMFFILIRMKEVGGSTGETNGQIPFALQAVVQMCAPAIMVGMVKGKVGALKLLLHERLAKEEDIQTQVQTYTLLRYIDDRQLYHEVCGMIPVDMKLIVALFGLGNTYSIVILQFSHLIED